MNTPPSEGESAVSEQLTVLEKPALQEQSGDAVFFSVSSLISDTDEAPATVEAAEPAEGLENKTQIDDEDVTADQRNDGDGLTNSEDAVVTGTVEIRDAATEMEDSISSEFAVASDDSEQRETSNQTENDVKDEFAVVVNGLEQPEQPEQPADAMEMGSGELGLGDCYGNICVTLESKDLWHQFDGVGTEMIITKAGRRMFPALIVSVVGLEPESRYTLFLDIVPVDGDRYKYLNSKWMVVGKAEREMEPPVKYVHPESPNTGQHWMSQKISFKKMKLTNNKKNTQEHLVLNSMHKYRPRLHIVRDGEDGSDDTKHGVFSFKETKFVAVTAYQNDQITQLKIDNNPFAKAFRDSPQESDLMRGTGWPHPLYHTPLSPVPIPDSPYFSQDYATQMRFAHVPYGPWDSAFVPSPRTPMTPVTPFRQQDSLSGWSSGYGSVSTPLATQCGPDEVFANPYSTYSSAMLHQQAMQVPLTPITPANLDAYGASVYNGSLASQTTQQSVGGDPGKYPSSMMPAPQHPFQFQHASYCQNGKYPS